jgi:hypothetical protein
MVETTSGAVQGGALRGAVAVNQEAAMERVKAESGATCEVCHEPLTTTDLNESEHRCERHPMVEEASDHTDHIGTAE